MKIEDFYLILRNCKNGNHTGSMKLKCQVNPERTEWRIYTESTKCKHCGHTAYDLPLVVFFHSPQEHLTIFEANLLFMVFRLNKKPLDYAQYHKCIAGKRFIENISEVRA